MRAFVARSLVALLLAGCSSAAPAASPPPSTSAPQSAVVTAPTTVPTSAPTPTPIPTATPTPEPSAGATTLKEYLVAWQSDIYAEADVVVAVQNTGNTWIALDPGQSDYTIYDSAGDVQETGNFLYAYPPDLAPGETGYLADDLVTSDSKAKNLKRVEADAYFDEIDESDAQILTTAKISNRKAQYTFEGPTTAGTVTNTSSDKIESAAVAAFYFDGSGKFLGFSSTNLVENLEPGQTKGFVTVDGAPYILLSHIKKTVVLAGAAY